MPRAKQTVASTTAGLSLSSMSYSCWTICSNSSSNTAFCDPKKLNGEGTQHHKNWKCYSFINYSAHLSFWVWWPKMTLEGTRKKEIVLLSSKRIGIGFWNPRVIICMHEFRPSGWVTFTTQLNYRPKSHLSILLDNSPLYSTLAASVALSKYFEEQHHR